MGTRDDVQSGCANTAIDQTIGNSSMCAIEDDPLPYFRSSDPRTLYGVDEPHSSYWSTVESGGVVGAGCGQLSEEPRLLLARCWHSAATPRRSPWPLMQVKRFWLTSKTAPGRLPDKLLMPCL